MVDLQAPARLRAKPVRITELNASDAGLIWYMRCIGTLPCINLVVPFIEFRWSYRVLVCRTASGEQKRAPISLGGGSRRVGMKTMKAVRIHTYGGPEVLKFENAPRPEPAPGEVLIKVNAAGVNPIDWKIRAGYLKEHRPYVFPLILGWDVSGIIEGNGLHGARFNNGDEVYARADIVRHGA